MVVFDPPIYIKRPDEDRDVIVFGKSPELRVDDLNNGIARIGGSWRAPDYMHAYVRAVKILVKNGMEANSLDDIGLPAFYLQRHAVELLLKRLLSWLCELAKFRKELGKDDHGVPSSDQMKRFKRTHNLSDLFRDLADVSEIFEFGAPPIEIKQLVDKISQFEISETFSRYERSEKNNEVIFHMKKEVALPLVDLQKRLEHIVFQVTYQPNSEDNYEKNLYEAWLCAARDTGHAG